MWSKKSTAVKNGTMCAVLRFDLFAVIVVEEFVNFFLVEDKLIKF